jgi:hypothetical protein
VVWTIAATAFAELALTCKNSGATSEVNRSSLFLNERKRDRGWEKTPRYDDTASDLRRFVITPILSGLHQRTDLTGRLVPDHKTIAWRSHLYGVRPVRHDLLGSGFVSPRGKAAGDEIMHKDAAGDDLPRQVIPIACCSLGSIVSSIRPQRDCNSPARDDHPLASMCGRMSNEEIVQALEE